jgi:hypothetical protein
MRLATSLLALFVVLGIPSRSVAAPVTWIFSGPVTEVPEFIPPCWEGDEGQQVCEPEWDLVPFVKVGDPWTLRLQFDPDAFWTDEGCTPPFGRVGGPMTGSLNLGGHQTPVHAGRISFGTFVDLDCHDLESPGGKSAEVTAFIGPWLSGIPDVAVTVFRLFTGFQSPFTGDFPSEPPGRGGHFELLDSPCSEGCTLMARGELRAVRVPEPGALMLLMLGGGFAAARLRTRTAKARATHQDQPNFS